MIRIVCERLKYDEKIGLSLMDSHKMKLVTKMSNLDSGLSVAASTLVEIRKELATQLTNLKTRAGKWHNWGTERDFVIERERALDLLDTMLAEHAEVKPSSL